MTQIKHLCIKCRVIYFDDDIDDYLCVKCNEERKLIAAEVDRKLAGQPRKPTKSLLQEYDEAPKVGGFMVYKI